MSSDSELSLEQRILGSRASLARALSPEELAEKPGIKPPDDHLRIVLELQQDVANVVRNFVPFPVGYFERPKVLPANSVSTSSISSCATSAKSFFGFMHNSRVSISPSLFSRRESRKRNITERAWQRLCVINFLPIKRE